MTTSPTDDIGHAIYPVPQGMVERLTLLGFTLDRPHKPGTIHFEHYW